MRKKTMVDFHKYCPLCEHKDYWHVGKECRSCFMKPVRINSDKPYNFKEKEK